jgi:hypothetical protein
MVLTSAAVSFLITIAGFMDVSFLFLANARPELLPEAGATQERTLEAVSSRPWFGAVQLMRKAVWKVLRSMVAPWDSLPPPAMC